MTMRSRRPFSPEFALVAACALADDATLQDCGPALLARPGFDWSAFAGQATYHGVEQIARSRLEIVAPGAMAKELEGEFQRLQVQSTALQAVQLRSSVAIARLMAEAGVPMLFLKGAALAHLLYSPNPEFRASSDIDVLVPPESLSIADEVLRRAGYKRTWPEAEPPAAARPALLMLANVFEYHGPVYGELVELHCRPTLNPYWLNVPFAELEASSIVVETGQGPLRTIAGPVCLEYLSQHALFYLAGFRLKWFGDIARMRSREGATAADRLPGRATRLADEVLLALAAGIAEAAGHRGAPTRTSRDAAWLVRQIADMREISTTRTFSRLPLEFANLSLVLRRLPGWRARGHALLQALSDPRDALALRLGPRFAVLYGLAGPMLALSRYLARTR